MTLRVLVVDDELLARRRLVRLLSAMADVDVAGERARAEDALAFPDADVVLLDIDMPGLSGIEALRRWPAEGPVVVLCTAHAQHALTAFDGGAVDYLLKPVDAARLALALERARARRRPAPRLALDSAHGVVLVEPLDVSHLVLEGALVSIHLPSGPLFSALSLSELEGKLPAERFVRVHRRAIVQLDRVARFDSLQTGGLVARMQDGSLVPISRQAARELRRRWRAT